ncbi:MAG: hypothetical protein IKK55_02715 [Clostridia bacterium]|nr:hypothetical protein [Clostridia bacterium]
MKLKGFKVLSVFTVVMLTVFIIATSLLPAFAVTNQKIDEVNVTVTLPMVGATDSAVNFTVSDDRYTVTAKNGVWREADDITTATQFVSGNIYRTVFDVVANTGYELTADTIVKVNGSQENIDLLGDESSPAGIFEIKVEPIALGTVATVELTDVPKGSIGDTADKYSYDGGDYSVEGIWQKYNFTTKAFDVMENTAKFEKSGIYRLALSVKADLGYEISYDTLFTINGEHYNFESIGNEATAYLNINHADEIDYIEIDDKEFLSVNIGDKFKDNDIKTIDAGSGLIASGYWHYFDEEGIEHTSGTFEKGKAYEFVLQISPKKGYAISENVYIKVDGKEYWTDVRNHALVEFEIRKSFATVIKEVELLKLPKAVVGEKAKKDVFSVKVPDGAKYTAQANWYLLDKGMFEPIQTDTFEKGKMYVISVDISPKKGYELSEDVIVKAYGVKHKLYGSTYDLAVFTREFSFLKVIDKVEINGVINPKDGKKATLDGLKVPSGAKYTIEFSGWMDIETQKIADVFENGKDYVLQVGVRAKDGYEFSDDAILLLDGKELYLQVYRDEGYFEERFSLKKVIEKIEISDIPEMKIGKTAKTEVKIPDGANYSANVIWNVWNEKIKCYEPFEGTFEDGKIYNLNIIIQPKEGYRVLEDKTTFLVDGKKSDNAIVRFDMASYSKNFVTNNKLIKKVELKVEKYVIGDHASIKPQVSIVGGKGFTLNITENGFDWLKGDIDDYKYFEDYFEKGAKYGVNFNILADEGYVFADDLVVVVNGITLPDKAIGKSAKLKNINYFFDMKNVVYSPSTQHTPIFEILFIVTILSLIAYTVLNKKTA